MKRRVRPFVCTAKYMRVLCYLATMAVLICLAGCRKDSSTTEPAASSSAIATGSSGLGPPPAPPLPRRGMIWIPPGALVAGTAPDSLPRIADEEIPGEQVVMKGFYIDNYPYPNEEGAIPLTSVSQAEAAGSCAEQGKRLCTELEWERACKGPKNSIYEYGDRYRPERCGTGAPRSMRPSGLRVGCSSEFGVADMHGGVWEWTSSAWGRGVERALATVRGGNAAAGELVGRCANAMGRPATSKSGTVGFRCCAGPKNEAEVLLHVDRTTKLEHKPQIDRGLAKLLLANLPPDAQRELGKPEDFKIDRSWDWWPIGNEKLMIAGGCAGLGSHPACGILVVRVTLGRPKILAWAASGHWIPTLQTDLDDRDVWLFGGDELGSFRRLVAYVWGRVSVGQKERRIPKPHKKKSDKPKKQRL